MPESWGLDFTLALTFIALVVPRLKDRASTGAAIAASVVAIVGFALPYKLGLMAAALIGIVVGMIDLEPRPSSSFSLVNRSELQHMNYWLIILAMGLVTFGIRLLPIVLLGRIEIPLVVQRALRFVPPAVLSAIIAPELLMPGGEFEFVVGQCALDRGRDRDHRRVAHEECAGDDCGGDDRVLGVECDSWIVR